MFQSDTPSWILPKRTCHTVCLQGKDVFILEPRWGRNVADFWEWGSQSLPGTIQQRHLGLPRQVRGPPARCPAIQHSLNFSVENVAEGGRERVKQYKSRVQIVKVTMTGHTLTLNKRGHVRRTGWTRSVERNKRFGFTAGAGGFMHRI